MKTQAVMVEQPEYKRTFSDVVLQDLAIKMFEDMLATGNRTLALIPDAERVPVLHQCACWLIGLAAEVTAEQHKTDRATAARWLQREMLKKMEAADAK